MSPYDYVTRRDMVCHTAAKEPEEALTIALSIREPWYRCQALSCVAMYIIDPKARRSILQEALDAADEAGEPNRIVSVSAWPLNVLLECGEQELFSKELQRRLRLLPQEPNPLRRQDALFCLVWHIENLQGKDLDVVLCEFKAACIEGHGSRTERNLKYMADILAQRAPDWSAEFATLRQVKKAERREWKAARERRSKEISNR